MLPVPQIKICGITDSAFAQEAVKWGVPFLGLIFEEKSPRFVTKERARAICEACGKGTSFVGVFTHHTVDEIQALAQALPLSVAQLHGPYTPQQVRAVEKFLPVWLLDTGHEPTVQTQAILVDAARGGSGQHANWARVAALKKAHQRVVLAGGLTCADLPHLFPLGADVLDFNSSLECAPGVKSPERLNALMEAYHRLLFEGRS